MDKKQAMKEWLRGRPKAVKQLAKEFPPGYEFEINEIRYYVIGYHEPDALVISKHNPALDYQNATKDNQMIHAEHLRGGKQDG